MKRVKVSLFSLGFFLALAGPVMMAQSDHPLSGEWSGDWGPSPTHRNPVVIELRWDGRNLAGTINPGPEAIELTTASFDAATETLTMEATATAMDGDEVQYRIEGDVEGNTITGMWMHDHPHSGFMMGDFRVSK